MQFFVVFIVVVVADGDDDDDFLLCFAIVILLLSTTTTYRVVGEGQSLHATLIRFFLELMPRLNGEGNHCVCVWSGDVAMRDVAMMIKIQCSVPLWPDTCVISVMQLASVRCPPCVLREGTLERCPLAHLFESGREGVDVGSVHRDVPEAAA